MPPHKDVPGTCEQMGLQWRLGFPAGAGIVAVALPELGADALSSNPYLHQIIRHYSMPVAAVLLCATVCTDRQGLVATPPCSRYGRCDVLRALLGCVLWGDLPFSGGRHRPSREARRRPPQWQSVNRLVREVPPSTPLSLRGGELYTPPPPPEPRPSPADLHVPDPIFTDPITATREIRHGVELPLLPRRSSTCCYRRASHVTGTWSEGAQRVLFDRFATQFRVVDQTSGVVLYERKGT